jgi:DNA-binding transcriptional regulator YiaG
MSQEWTPEQVKELRLRLGKTQKEFAEMLGVHVVTIIRWEKGNFNPSKMALKLLDTYDAS